MRPVTRSSDLRRSLLTLACCAVLVSSSGCGTLGKFRLWPTKTAPLPQAQLTKASLEDIVDHINDSRSRLTCWRSTDVRIKADGEGILEPTLSAKICVQSPRSLRLTASSLVGPEVDFGANDERFWLWIKRQEPKVVLTGSHEGQGRQELMPIPFSPSWLMEALGVIPIQTRGLRLETDPGTPHEAKLVSAVEDGGKATRRIMVVDRRSGLITRHALYDDNDELVASAEMSDFRATGGFVLPHAIELNWPETKTILKMKIGKIEVNPNVPETTFKLPSYPDYRLVDLDHEVPLRR